MTYTGNVTPGGPSDTRELTGLTIRKVSVGDFDNGCYLLTCTASGDQLLVDAATDAQRLLALVGEGTGRLDSLLTTHRHPDHVRALAELARRTGATTLAGDKDADALPAPTDRRLEHGEEIRLGEQTLQVIGLRGHTPGGIALAWTAPEGQTHLFSGDSLFPGGVGNTDSDPKRFEQLLTDVEERVFNVYGDDTWVYPGHGSDTTLGAERPHLPEWRTRGW